MALNDNALITWAKAQALLDLDDADQTKTENYINIASDYFDRYVNRTIKATDYTSYFQGNGKDFLILPNFPVNSLTMLKIDSGRDFGDNSEYTENEDFDIDYDAGIIYLFSGTFPKSRRVIYVEYNAGYSTIPEDIQLSIAECVAWLDRRLPGGGVGIRNETFEGISMGLELDIPISIRSVWDGYRDKRI